MNKKIAALTFALAAALCFIPARAQAGKEVITLTPESDLTIYTPAKPNGKCVMMCPGGGYGALAIRHEGHDMAQWFTDQGIAYAVLRYRLPKEPLDTLPMIDAHAALRILADNASRLSIDPAKIGIMGASAGGHLASHIANTDSLVAFQALLYPVITMDTAITHMGTHNNLIGKEPTPEVEAAFSNDLLVSASTPKAIIILSADDKVVPPANSIRYFTALQANGVPVEMHIYPIGDHGWGFKDYFTYKQQWLAALQEWLTRL